MPKTEIVCSKCAYHNQPHRSTCKNCGEALTPEAAIRQQVVITKRKKPLKQWSDWLKAVIGLTFFVATLFCGALAINAAIHQSLVSLLFLIFSAGFLYGSLVLFLFPLYYLYIFQQGHEVTEGEIMSSFEKEYPREDGSTYTERFMVIDFVPEKSHDPRPRHLTCGISPGVRVWSDNRKFLVYYALKNPDIMLFEGEV
jgi:hypothetical protein